MHMSGYLVDLLRTLKYLSICPLFYVQILDEVYISVELGDIM